jgi:tetratricopeptide (TPR) repeat protein
MLNELPDMIRLRTLLLAGAAASAALAPVFAAAQSAGGTGSVARPVVQALPDPIATRLAEVLRALARDPNSLSLLVEAGEASLKLDDAAAAETFFKRAQSVDPGDARLKAGLAGLALRQDRVTEALGLYQEAEQAGVPMAAYAADRGLAFDLVGDGGRAQQHYRQALALGPDPVVSMRLAISQAIAGDSRGSEATLLPLLQRSDLSAYRTRAFALAIGGQEEEAVSIAETMLPEQISGRIAPYLRFMERLTPAQQAAAANLGRFPRSDEIGKDGPAIAAWLARQPALAASGATQAADARLVPAGQPLGPSAAAPASAVPVAARRQTAREIRAERAARSRAATPPVRVVEAVPIPTPERVPAASVAAVAPANTQPAGSALASAPVQAPAQPDSRPVVVATLAQSPQDQPSQVQAPPTQPVTQTSPVPVVAPPPPRDLAQAFADFARPAPVAVAEGAVDISTIRIRREPPPAPRTPPPPPKPVHPSRHWAQIATGRDTGALAFDWRRLKREAGTLLDKYQPQVAKWGQTNRMVVGPFASTREADQFIASLKGKTIDSFRFTSDEGEEVKPL